MRIAIIGTGYVGLVSGACFAEMGVQVVCVDIDSAKIQALRQGIIPIYEPGLEEIVQRNQSEGRLSFETDIRHCINQVDIVFLAVGTPPDAQGNANLSYVFQAARDIGSCMEKPLLIVTKSTVPVGTSYKVQEVISQQLRQRGVDIAFDIASNPEFLKEGAAIQDFMSPDRVVVGTDSERAKALITKLYRPFLLKNFRVIFMSILSAEITKYASNAMLATRISFMNELALLCEKVGADIDDIRRGMGADKRIGNAFLYAGCGYGGSCFPKDVKALVQSARELGLTMNVVHSVDCVNEQQKQLPYQKIVKHHGSNLKGKIYAVWGLSFKPETDDLREAPSLVLIKQLLQAGATVRVYDPVAMEAAKKELPQQGVYYASDLYDAALGADAALLITEWKQFRIVDWKQVQQRMRGTLLIDGRNIYDPADPQSVGLVYEGIGRPAAPHHPSSPL